MSTSTVFLIATGKYKTFLHQSIRSIEMYWPDDTEIRIFTDEPSDALDMEHIHQYKIKHEPWPYPTLLRFHYFLSVEEDIKSDYVYYVDVDARFVDQVDVKGDLVGVRHCGYYFGKQGPEEPNPDSAFYGVRFKEYYGGGFFGGKKELFFHMSNWCKVKIDEDLAKGIIPIHNDETALNAYFAHLPPTLKLTPDYHYPEDKEYFIENCWNGVDPFSPKLLLLKKDHAKIRS